MAVCGTGKHQSNLRARACCSRVADMKHAVWMLHDLAHGFEFYMGWYFTLPLVAALLLTSGLVTFLTRSRKVLLATAVMLMLLFGGFALCQWTNVEWKLYCYGMYGQFHVPAPYSNDLCGETKMCEDKNPQESVPAASPKPTSLTERHHK